MFEWQLLRIAGKVRSAIGQRTYSAMQQARGLSSSLNWPETETNSNYCYRRCQHRTPPTPSYLAAHGVGSRDRLTYSRDGKYAGGDFGESQERHRTLTYVNVSETSQQHYHSNLTFTGCSKNWASKQIEYPLVEVTIAATRIFSWNFHSRVPLLSAIPVGTRVYRRGGPPSGTLST